MSKTYEARANIHVPALKCSYPAGTRFVVNEEIVAVGDQEFEINNEFKLLIRHGMIKELTLEESKSPEEISAPKTLKSPERKKMPVQMEDTTVTPLASRKAKESDDARIVRESVEAEEGKTIRGMKVISEESTPIKKLSEETPKTSTKKELTEAQKAEIEAKKQARVASANAAIKENENKAKKPLSDAQKAALAKARAKAKAKREAKAKESNSTKGE